MTAHPGHVDGPPQLHIAPAVFPDDFDPDTVPRYPVLVLEVATATDDDTTNASAGYQVRLNGQPIPVPAEPTTGHEDYTALEHAFDAAVSAAARFIAARSWPAARVNAVGPDGERWPMIIGPRGERHDLTTPPAAPRQPRWFLPTVAALLAVAVAVAAVGIALRPSTAPTAAGPVPPVQPTAQPAELPVLPPPGSTTHARWTYGPLAEATGLALGPTSGILVRTTDQLTLLDPSTGQPTWSTPTASSTTGPWSTTVDTVAVVVTVDNTTLTWRPWHDLNQVHTVELAENTTVKALPGGILLLQPDQRAQLLTNTGTTTRLIPAGATPVGIENTTLLASNGRQIWRLDTDAPQTPTPSTLQPPVSGAQPSTATPVWKAGHLLSFWTTPAVDGRPERTYAALHDRDGSLAKALPVTDASLGPDDLASPRYTALTGRYVVDHQALKLITLPADWQTTALVDNEAFGTVGDHAARYTLTSGKLITSDTPAEATPVGIVGNELLAVATLSTGPALYRLASQ